MPSASPARIAANRANAQRSTGPRTTAGKQRSSQNAFRHGLTAQTIVMPGEDAAAYTDFQAGIVADLQPVGLVEHQLAERIANAQWRLNRIAAIEDNLFALAHAEPCADFGTNDPEIEAAFRTARCFTDNAKVFLALSMYEQRIQRNFEQNAKLLHDLQSARRARREPAVALPKPSISTKQTQFPDRSRSRRNSAPPTIQSISTGVGFVFANEPCPATKCIELPSNLSEIPLREHAAQPFRRAA